MKKGQNKKKQTSSSTQPAGTLQIPDKNGGGAGVRANSTNVA